MVKQTAIRKTLRKPVRILLADDHEIVCRGLRAVLETEPNWEIVGEVKNGRDAVRLAQQLKPHIVLMDISMPDLNGLEAIRQMRSSVPQALVLVLTIHASEELMREVIGAGAQGYVLKSDAGCDLVNAVHSLLAGKPFFTARAARLVLSGFLKSGQEPAVGAAGDGLSPREREVVQLIAEGKSNKEIALKLGVSLNTVETHRSRIMQKLNLGSVADLTRYAIRNRIIEP